jgi:UDP-N-acetylglucosamine--N-acetylmuramyl-(pentapeptide) pyrophosphoryl-undecaprenol N-acetylglucosamine transferase
MERYRFLISGGGTGGHIYPAIAIADELRLRFPDAKFLFVGARDRMEMEKVPRAGYEIRGLWISGLERRLSLKNLLFPFKLVKSLLNAYNIVREFKPDLVVGTGGFASGPVLRIAGFLNIPYVLQEQNSYAGITNKMLAGKAKRIFVAYEGMQRFFPEPKIVFAGNPVRSELVDRLPIRSEAIKHFNLNGDKPVLLVLGGSLGARRINQLIADKNDFIQKLGFQILWQCGQVYYAEYKGLESENMRILSYVQEMNMAYSAANLIISRAGAGSVSELSIVGKPVVFIPSPNVAEDHQTKNAMSMADQGAAILLPESELETEFEHTLQRLVSDAVLLESLGENFKKQGKPGSTALIVDEIEKLLAR